MLCSCDVFPYLHFAIIYFNTFYDSELLFHLSTPENLKLYIWLNAYLYITFSDANITPFFVCFSKNLLWFSKTISGKTHKYGVILTSARFSLEALQQQVNVGPLLINIQWALYIDTARLRLLKLLYDKILLKWYVLFIR